MSERETKIIKISNFDVFIITYLTWGEKEEIQNEVTNGVEVSSEGMKGYDSSALLKAKYKLLEIGIVKIKSGEKEIPYSKEWMKNLKCEDGDLIYEALDELQQSKKK